jgi:hypothetical protein
MGLLIFSRKIYLVVAYLANNALTEIPQSNPYFSIAQLLVLLGPSNASIKNNYSYSLFSYDLNYYFAKASLHEAFLGASLQAGSCGQIFLCNVSGHELRIGLQFYIPGGFIFIQENYQDLFFSSAQWFFAY